MTHEADTSNFIMSLRPEDEELFQQPTKVNANSDRREQYLKATKSDAELRLSFGRWSIRDKMEWTCLTCTYHNQPLFLTCEMCGQARPPPDALPISPTAVAAAATGGGGDEPRRVSDSSLTNIMESSDGDDDDDIRDRAFSTGDLSRSEFSPDQLRKMLTMQQEEKIKKERIKEIMALQQGIFSKIQEENESQENDTENGESQNLEDSFSWMELEDRLSIKDHPSKQKEESVPQPVQQKTAKPFDASNTTCTTAASSTSHLSLEGSSHHSQRRRSSRSNIYPSLREVSSIDEGGDSSSYIYGSFSEFGETSQSFAYGNSSHRSLGLGSSIRSIGSDYPAFASSTEFGVSNQNTSPRESAAATARSSSTSSEGKISPTSHSFRRHPGTVETNARPMDSCNIRGNTSSNIGSFARGRIPRVSPRGGAATFASSFAAAPGADEDIMPETPRDVPIPAVALQRARSTDTGIPRQDAPLSARTEGPSAKAMSLYSSSSWPTAFPQRSSSTAPAPSTRSAATTTISSTTIGSEIGATLPSNNNGNSIFEKNLYAERNKRGHRSKSPVFASTGNKEGRGVPILRRMLARKKSA